MKNEDIDNCNLCADQHKVNDMLQVPDPTMNNLTDMLICDSCLTPFYNLLTYVKNQGSHFQTICTSIRVTFPWQKFNR